MPPKQTYTKEIILEAAERLMKAHGFESVNARSIAKELSCSTQPIYSYFATMEELKTELYDVVTRKYMESINAKKDEKDFFKFATNVFISTAKNDRHLYRFIYNSHNFDGKSLDELLNDYETNRVICDKLKEVYSLTEEQGKMLFFKIWFFVYGISTMLASNKPNIPDEELYSLVNGTIGDIIRSTLSGLETAQ